ncbi:MAG: DUF411 domain-containing protein [Candidatus Aenigmatarchaeota archaeon]
MSIIKIRVVISFIIILVLIGAVGFFVYQLYFPKAVHPFNKLKNLITEDVVIYISPNCGCCALYANYLKNQGISIKVSYIDDISSIKSKYSIPINMQSCHTTIIGNYFVEGHVPVEAILKLMEEKPNITGIALPGMPSGSPGMTGVKYNPFRIYSIDYDGAIHLFTIV